MAARLRVRVSFGSFLCVHGSPRRPINEYVFPEDAINSPVKMQQIFDRIQKYCMVGHTHVPGVFTDEPDFYPPDDLEGVVLDDVKAEFAGSWQASSASKKFVGFGYRHDGNAGDGKATARFAAKLPKAGRYHVFFGYTPNSNRASNVRVEVQHAGGSQTFTVNQKLLPPEDDLFLPLGVFEFQDGTPAVVTVSNHDADGYVVVDAVQWMPVTR